METETLYIISYVKTFEEEKLMLIKKLMKETGFETIIDSIVNSNKLEFPGGDSNNTYFNYRSG